MRAIDVLDKVELTTGKNNKVAVLKDSIDDEQLRFLLDAALNFKRKFHIKKFNESVVGLNSPSSGSFEDFKELLHILENRIVTGHEAMQCVDYFFAALRNGSERKWYSRVLRKDLRAGFDVSTVEKAGFKIPKFDVMLAKDGTKCKKLYTVVQDGVYCSPKLDGYRCIAICQHGDVTLLSRNGTEYVNFPSIQESLGILSRDSSFVLDGEIMSTDFSAMQKSAFASKRGTVVGDVVYEVFGWIAMDEWESENFKMPTKQRLDNLSAFMDGNSYENIRMVEQKLVYKIEEIVALQDEYESQGLEGVMVLPNVPYYKGRKSNKLMKFKTMESQDCDVVGFYEGTGKYEGCLGGIHLLQEDGKTKCDVGSGFTDDDRKYIWENQGEFIGRKMEVKYQELTGDGVMRFPVYLRWRNDK